MARFVQFTQGVNGVATAVAVNLDEITYLGVSSDGAYFVFKNGHRLDVLEQYEPILSMLEDANARGS